MFREAFKIVASELKTCGNLLERIREEYEVSLKRIAMELKHSEKEKKR